MKDNYYHILEIENFATQEEIKSAWRHLAKKYHPDKNPGNPELEDKFKQINKAYQVLIDPVKKKQFDYQLLYPHMTAVRAQSRRTYYSTEKRRYTPKAWMYGKIFIILFIMTVVLIPAALLYKSSITSYKKGVEAYEKSNYYEALAHFNRAIKLFGGKSPEAAIKGAEISIYAQENYKQGLYFANKGLEYAEEVQHMARLYYLQGIAYKYQHNYDKSMESLLKADSLYFRKDSIQLQVGLLNAFSLYNFKQGEENFEYLIREQIHLETAWFGKGWCEQNLGKNESAIESYSELIKIDENNPMGWFYRGMNYITLSDSTEACSDFKRAAMLGYSKAKERFEYHCKEK